MALFVKLWTDILGDPKLFDGVRGGARHLQLLPWLLAVAKQANDDGRLSVNGHAMHAEDIARLVPNATARQVERAIAELAALNILTLQPDGIPRFRAWATRAGGGGRPSDAPDQIRARVARHRERTRNAASPSGDTDDGNDDGNAEYETRRNALQDLVGNEGELEQELEQEQENTHGASGDAPRGGDAVPAAGESADPPDPSDQPSSCYAEEFEAAWACYPKRPNNPKKPAYKAWVRLVGTGAPAAEMHAAVERYARYVTTAQVAPEHVMQAQTFFGPNERWRDPFETPARVAGHITGERGTPEWVAAADRWTFYQSADLLNRWAKPEYERRGAALVEEGMYPSVDAFLAELRITRPWTLNDVATDDVAIRAIRDRLAATRTTPSEKSA